MANKIEINPPGKPPFWIFRDTTGRKSTTMTFATIAFFVTAITYILSIFEKIGPFTIRSFDSSACATFLTPILTLYFFRKNSEQKYPHKPQNDTANIPTSLQSDLTNSEQNTPQ